MAAESGLSIHAWFGPQASFATCHMLPTHTCMSASSAVQVRQFESVNFVDFARLLAAFSDRAPYDDKIKFIFKVYDVDGDGEWYFAVPKCPWWLLLFEWPSLRSRHSSTWE